MIGTTIGHYTIESKLGEGGMGVVFRATDTKLDRVVALKFLPEHVSAGSSDLDRFTQEAKAAAGLNHPNICTIYGIETLDAKNFIVMEFVDGQTLQEKKASLSLKQALDIGIQIAEGLAAAHEKGIVHRDIKPENIMVRKDGRVQIMDFGLAKLRGASRLTKEGSTVGTAGYMSPEQVQGQETDHRSDIFSLGVLLYEMLTGQPPFKGVHETAIAYEIVNVDAPPMSSVRQEIPPELDAIVLECLEKDPRERMQSAGQVAVDLKRFRRESSRSRASKIVSAVPVRSAFGRSSAPAAETRPATTSLRWLIAGAAALALFALGYVTSWFLPGTHINRHVIRASVLMPPGVQYQDVLGGNSSVSPDGSAFLFVGRDSSGKTLIWVRRFDEPDARPVANTDGASYPFWSYDSKSIGFFADGSLRTIAATGGPVVSLALAPFGRGAAWGPDGTIVFSPNLTDPNLYAVSHGGGDVRAVTRFDTSIGKVPRFPSYLPDGDHVVFSMLTLNANDAEIYVASVHTGESTKLANDGANPVYANGHLLFVRQQILMAQPFDAGKFVLSGQPATIQGNLNGWAPRAKADFSSSEDGILLYASGTSTRSGEDEFAWMDARGNETTIIRTGIFAIPSISRDGTRLAYGQAQANGGTDIWTYDIDRRVTTRLTFVAPNSSASHPVWSRDKRTVFYNSEQLNGKATIFAKRSDGSGTEELLANGGSSADVGYYPSDVSPDDRYLLFDMRDESKSGLAMLDLAQTARPLTPVSLAKDGRSARFSPDGRWIVYEAGRRPDSRVVVSEFRGRSGTWQVSPTDAEFPVWVGSRIIFWSTSLSSYMEVGVSVASGSPVFGQPTRLNAATPKGGGSYFIYGYSPTRKAFLIVRPVGTISGSQLSVIINWPQMVQ